MFSAWICVVHNGLSLVGGGFGGWTPAGTEVAMGCDVATAASYC